MNLKQRLRRLGCVQENVCLKGFTTFKIGGKAEYLFSSSSGKSLREAASFLKRENIPYYILGGGSNLLVSSSVLEGVVIDPLFKEIEIEKATHRIKVGAKVAVGGILKMCLENSWGGLEFLAGLRARVGGLIANNASFGGEDISQKVEKVRVLDFKTSKIYWLENKDINWGYRTAGLRDFIILEAVFVLSQKSSEKAASKIKANIQYRLKNQELTSKSAGCIFRNPQEGLSAGELIEKAGLKGFRNKQAVVSSKHANFILNESCAKSWDVIFLIEQIKDKVKQDTGICLEEEIQRWGC
jgi:UDP-N-acetylmuramate dehydrogenase